MKDSPRLLQFFAFDPSTKMAAANTQTSQGQNLKIAKGAGKVIEALSTTSALITNDLSELESKGYRVLGVAAGEHDALNLIGFIGLSDPPQADSATLISQLAELGVRTVMVTGDSAATAATFAKSVGLDGKVCPTASVLQGVNPSEFRVFAGVLPVDKFNLVQTFRQSGHTVGMCGDGPNDAPALRQAQMGIAVSTATDVAKSAAGIVLTAPGLVGIVSSVCEGRRIFQRVLTYILKSVTHKFVGALFLAVGVLMTGRAVLTPKLLVISMITGDFLSILAATDNVHLSEKPNSWNVKSLTLAGIILGFCDLIFCTGVLAFSKYKLHLPIEAIRSLSPCWRLKGFL